MEAKTHRDHSEITNKYLYYDVAQKKFANPSLCTNVYKSVYIRNLLLFTLCL